MAELRIKLLGGWELSRDGMSVTVSSRKTKCLLALLARVPGRRHPREALAALLWPDSPELRARTSLRQSLKLARTALAGGIEPAVTGEDGDLYLQPSAADVDVVSFERLLDSSTLQALEQAKNLYRGEFLAGLAPPGEAFADWAAMESVRLRDRAACCLSRLLTHYEADERNEDAIEVALQLLALDPLQESVHRRLIALYLELGRHGLARAQYRNCRELLARELGVEPELATGAPIRASRFRSDTRIGHAPDRAQEGVVTDPFVARPAVAVLPFTDLCGSPDRDFFGEGLCEEVITALAVWRRFPLIASSSTLALDDERRDPQSAARVLGARYVVGGTIRRSGSRLRITVRLEDGGSGRSLWAERYDAELGDIFAVQDEVAREIAAMVESELERAEARRIRLRRTEDLSSWEHWLRGLRHLRQCTAEGNARARARFREALRLDPGFSDALTGLAKTHSQDVLFRCAVDRPGSIAEALQTARRAVALDPSSSDAHLALAAANVWAGNMAVAIPLTRTSIELNPSNAHARMALGNRLDLIGETEAGIAEMERGLQLNPRDPRRFTYMAFLARAHTSAARPEQALAWAERAVRVRPDQPDMHFRLAVCLANLDRREEARAALAECEHLRAGFLKGQTGWRPYSDPVRNGEFFAGLERHGFLA